MQYVDHLAEGRSEMDRKETMAKVESSEELAGRWEEAVHLNGAGARAIRELTNIIRNYSSAESAMNLIADSYEKMLEKDEKRDEATHKLHREMLRLMRRVAKLEDNGNGNGNGNGESTA